MPWYEEAAIDFIQSPFLFVGTKLNEPLFKYHIERYKQIVGKQQGVSYVITPDASEIEKLDLQSYNIIHIAGTLEGFVQWIEEEIPQPPKPLELAISNNPQLAAMYASSNQLAYSNLFDGVTLVNRSNIAVLKKDILGDSVRPVLQGI